MFKMLKKSEKGIILVTVLIIITVMTLLTFSMISLNVSEVMKTKSSVRSLTMRKLAEAAYWRAYANYYDGNPYPIGVTSYTETVNGIAYLISVDHQPGIPEAPDNYSITVNLP